MDTLLRGRRALLLLAPAAFGARLLKAQGTIPIPDLYPQNSGEARLPGTKKQQDEILKMDYEKNLREARDLVEMAKAFEEDLERDDRFVLSLNSLKKLDNMENALHRIRGRLKKI